ncbi:MAG: CheR family methyltransferase [Gemmatimonadota bacterium]|nr:CheR family methyltransferase [Gemmatimonadota bacterium]
MSTHQAKHPPHRHAAGSTTHYVLGEREFAAFRGLIYDAAGIALTDAKRDLVSSRLARRVRALRLGGFDDYLALLERTPAGEGEWTPFINALTTNLTSFFREPHHFTVLTRALKESRGTVRIWSAGCSTGEEPWSIAMTAREVLGQDAGRVRILATDLDTDVLATASAGIYPDDVTGKLDPAMQRKYFEPARGAHDGLLAIKQELRPLVRFTQVNLVRDEWGTDEPFDMIFCRNVVIYFDSPTRAQLFAGFTQALRPGGLLILGHSEGLGNAQLPLTPLGQTVWRRQDGLAPHAPHSATPARGAAAPSTATPRITRPAHTSHAHATRPAPAATRPATATRTTHGAMPRVPTAHGNGVRGAAAHHARNAATHRPAGNAEGERPTTRIVIGGICASAAPRTVRTVLGSCIAACLWDPATGIGGMNHFMLPEGSADPESASRFGIHAMELLINELMHLGADRRRIVAKVFGGASVLQLARQKENVAERNVAFIREFLKTESIAVRHERVGGTAALDVEFDTDTGDARARAIDNTRELPSVAAEEQRYRERIKFTPRKVDTSSVELF